MLAFGVGPSIREEDLNEMAGERNWFYVEEFVDMKYRIHDILEVACNNTANPWQLQLPDEALRYVVHWNLLFQTTVDPPGGGIEYKKKVRMLVENFEIDP